MAIDKPAGWMLAPDSWHETGRNLQAVLAAGIAARDFWARKRNLRFLRYLHRLDAETSGIVLLAKSQGAIAAYSRLFAGGQMDKRYLAVVEGVPKRSEWVCRLKLGPFNEGRVRVDARQGKEAETAFRVLKERGGKALLEAQPLTGRTHQIRVHLAESGHPIVGDTLYGKKLNRNDALGLRAVGLEYVDPFTHRRVSIRALFESFVQEHGFECSEELRNSLAGRLPPKAPRYAGSEKPTRQ